MIAGLGTTGIILLLLIALLLFGPQKLPELGRAFGKTISEFRHGSKTIIEDEQSDQQKLQSPK